MPISEATLDAFDEILNDGTLGKNHMRAYMLVESYPGLTVRELFQKGVQDGIISPDERNPIQPRITEMATRHGIIIRPKKRVCRITGRPAFENFIAPESWREKRKTIKQSTNGRVVKNRIEVESKTTRGLFHTVIEWHDGDYFCSCNQAYNRPEKYICHHINGLKLARTGENPKLSKARGSD